MRPSGPPIDIILPAPHRPLGIPPYAGCLVKMIFGFTVLLVIGYCALVALNPKARKWATSNDGPTPFKSVNQILALPALMVGKTKAVVASNDARVGVLDRVIASESSPSAGGAAKPLTDPFGPTAANAPGPSSARAAAAAGVETNDNQVSREALLAMAARDSHPTAPRPEPARPAVVTPPPPPGPAELRLAGGVVVANKSPSDVPPASSPFMYWVASLNISGVSTGNPARFLMDGKLVREGDTLNRQLEVTFDHLDPTEKLIYFRDAAGAVVTRSY